MAREPGPSNERTSPGGAPASLALVNLRRGQRTGDKSAKTGDLTQLLSAKPSPTEAAPAASAAHAPAPANTLPVPVPPQPPAIAAPAPRLPAVIPTIGVPAVIVPPVRAKPATPTPQVAPAVARRETPPVPPRTASAAAPRDATPAAFPLQPSPYHRQGGDAFVDYWDELRHGHGVPRLATLDRDRVAGCWPDSLMVTYTRLDAAMPQIVRLSKPTGEIEYTPMVTDWIISCARQVARAGEAMEDEQEFPFANGSAGYRLLLLPFATADGKSQHVLCHLSRARKDKAA